MSNFRFTRPDNFPPVIKNIIIINVLVFVAQMMFDSQYHLTPKLGLWPVEADNFRPYQVFTHMFTHSPNNLFHILFNMLTLWMFGRILENVWGQKRFLFFYLSCGLGAALAHMAVEYFQYKEILNAINYYESLGLTAEADAYRNAPVYAVGASGAVMGVMVAFAFLFPNTPLYMMFLPIPIKAKWAILGFVAIDLFGGINPVPGDNIAHFAHLGGAVTGFIIVFLWNKTNRKTLY
ncbi:MAG TPA: rhomboid family intramembrane serine protease [Chitinophagaceae bacterium]